MAHSTYQGCAERPVFCLLRKLYLYSNKSGNKSNGSIFFVVALKVANIGVVAKQVLRTGHSLLIRHINGLLMATTVGH